MYIKVLRISQEHSDHDSLLSKIPSLNYVVTLGKKKTRERVTMTFVELRVSSLRTCLWKLSN